MKQSKYLVLSMMFLVSGISFAQEEAKEEVREGGHNNTNKFRQLYQEFSTPNQYRTASGAPGHAYYQQKADYKIDQLCSTISNQWIGYYTSCHLISII